MLRCMLLLVFSAFSFTAEPPFQGFCKITGDHAAAQAAVNSDLPALQAALNEAGIEVDRVTSYHANCIDAYSRTALMSAAEHGFTAGVSLLLEMGAQPLRMDRDGSNALHLAAAHGHVDIAQALVQAGASADDLNSRFQTPLMLAARNGHLKLVTLFLQGGAHVEARDVHNRTVFSYAALAGKSRVFNALKQHGTPSPNETRSINLLLAAKRQNSARAMTLLGAGVDPDIVDLNGKTPLMYFAAAGMAEATQTALMLGADMERTGPLGRTALMHAADAGKRNTLKLLLQSGADIDARTGLALDLQGLPIGTDDTALHLAAAKNRLEAYQLLVEAGADVEAQDLFKRTPQAVLSRTPMETGFSVRNNGIPTLSSNQNIVHPHVDRQITACPPMGIRAANSYVIMDAVVSSTGVVRDVRVVRTRDNGRFGLEKRAAAALKMWDIQPATLQDMEVDTVMTFKFDFH